MYLQLKGSASYSLSQNTAIATVMWSYKEKINHFDFSIVIWHSMYTHKQNKSCCYKTGALNIRDHNSIWELYMDQWKTKIKT